MEYGLSDAVKAGLFIGELELIAERAALHHLKIPCRVPVLDMVKQHLASEAEVAALAQGFERFVLRSYCEGVREATLAD